MRSFKNIFYSIFLVGFVFIAQLRSNALTIDQVIQSSNSLQPINIADINSKINYDYKDKIEEISSILDESLNSSKNANDKLKELNTLMISINEDNEALLNIKDKDVYNESVSTLKEKVEIAKQINTNAKTFSESGLDKYNEALAKYVSLKSELEETKEKTESLLNFNIGKVNTKLEIINKLLEELNKEEEKLKEAYNEANIAYENAKENANVANNNFSEKLEELKEYVDINGEQELNDLIEANTKYLTSGLLYATSQTALKLIDIEIELIEAEITSLEEDLALLDQELKPFEDIIALKEAELTTLNNELDSLNKDLNDNENVAQITTKISQAKAILANLEAKKEKIEEEKNTCSVYMPELDKAIEDNDSAKVVELLLKNEKSYGFTERNISVEVTKGYDSNFNEINYILVTDTDTNEEFVYSYEENAGEITIYKQEKVVEHPIDNLSDTLTLGKYLAYLNNQPYKIFNVNINENILGFEINVDFIGFIDDENKYYEVKRKNDGWFAIEKKVELTHNNRGLINGITLVDVSESAITVTEAEHYKRAEQGNPITSKVAKETCDGLKNNTIDEQINSKKDEIISLQNKLTIAKELENKIQEKNNEITIKENEIIEAKELLNEQKETLTNSKGMTYAEIENRLIELDEKLNHYPNIGDDNLKEDLISLAELADLIANSVQGNTDVISIIETIGNLNVGLNIKKEFIDKLDTILANNYNNAKQDLIDVAGEDLENISTILKDIAPLINEVAESNLKLLEEKVKLELAKENYNNLLDVKELVVNTKEDTLAELEMLEKLKKENNFDLSDLDAKFKETEEALINEIGEIEVKINDYKIIKKENTKLENTKLENNLSNKETDTPEVDDEENKQNNTANKEDVKEKGFNWLNLLWLLPIALIIFFIILFIKRKKEEEK